MASAVNPPSVAVVPSPTTLLSRLAADPLWRSPLVPVALAATAGIVLDRKLGVPFPVLIAFLILSLIAWTVSLPKSNGNRAMPWLWLAVAAIAAAWHHARQEFYALDDIGLSVGTDTEPVLVRAVIDDEPIVTYQA